MPTYEYECEHCGHRFEKFQSISERPVKLCPKCRHKVRRLPGSGGGIIFKGKGFYQTDYRSDSYRSAQKAEKKDSTEKKADKSAKTEGGSK